MLLTSRKPEIEMLSQELQKINDQLRVSLDYEMERLKQQEKELQEALKFRTRTELIKAMENELEMENLNQTNLSKSLIDFQSHKTQKSFDQTSEFMKSVDLESDLKKSHQILDNLMREYTATNYLHETAYNLKNQNLNSTTIRPNVVFTKSSKYAKNPRNIRTITIYREAPTQDLNKQQTLKYGNDQQQYMSRSFSDLDRSSYFDNTKLNVSNNPYSKPFYNQADYNRSIRDNKFYNGQEKINGISTSKIRPTTQLKKEATFETLPLTKTLIHKKPWSYGKVQTNYYTFRDMKLKKK